MFDKFYLTPSEKERIDPTGEGRKQLLKFVKGDPVPVPGPWAHKSRLEWLDEYRQLRTKVLGSVKAHRAYVDFDMSLEAKYGGQGDSFPIDEMLGFYEDVYRLAERPISISSKLRKGLNYLLRRIDEAVEKYGYPQYVDSKYYATNAAVPTFLEKGTYFAETVQKTEWMHPKENFPGQRSQRLKHRVINQDSVLNVRYIEKQLNAVRYWLREHLPEYFSAWLNPNRYKRRFITRHLRRHRPYSVETDYKACDAHFGLPIVLELILPVYERLLPHDAFNQFAAFIEELFWQPTFFGDYLITGLHNLLSGQAITNDFETIFDVILVLSAKIDSSIGNLDEPFVSLGDDLAVLLDCLLAQAEKLRDSMVDLATTAGMEIELSKSTIRFREVCFCRELYYPGLPWGLDSTGEQVLLGAYPSVLTLNNVINPERYSDGIHALMGATLQRLDGLHGSPFAYPFIQWIMSKAHIHAELDYAKIKPASSWWERLYGEDWSLDKSFAYKVLRQSNLLI